MTSKKGSVASEILFSIVDLCRLTEEWTANPHAFRRNHFTGWIPKEAWGRLTEPARQRRSMKMLRRKKWLDAKEKGSRIQITLHKDAMATVLKDRIRKTKKALPKGRWCLVIFDFPVGARNAASSWRHFIYSAGFRREQLSAWKTNKDVSGLMATLVNLLGAKKWITVYECREPI